ncbi:MAG: cyclic nucleotide-binding domain-containing protein [Chloroflexi bacterium]|nr:cyclic nucleotide-binding domain-containing protein [Chloroflexota bacterium]
MEKSLVILSQLRDEDAEWLLSAGQPRYLIPDQQLIQPGEPLNSLYFLADGALVVRSAANRELSQIHSGALVGEFGLLDPRKPQAVIVATRHSTLLEIPHYPLQVKLAQDAGFASRLYRGLALFLTFKLEDPTPLLSSDIPFTSRGIAEHELEHLILDNAYLVGKRIEYLTKRIMSMPSQ